MGSRFSIISLSRVLKLARIVLPLCLLLIVAVEIFPSDQAPQTTAVTKNSLKVESQFVKKTYCSPSNLRVTVRLTLTNVAERPIILDKHYFKPIQTLVATDLDSLGKGVFEKQITSLVGYYFLTVKVSSPVDPYFVVLQKGEQHVTDVDLYLPVDDGEKSNENDLKPGSHFVEAVILTWGGPEKLGKELRQKWESQGFLWLEAIVSKGVEFEVDKSPAIGECTSK